MDIYEQQDNVGREIFKTFCKRKQWCKHHKDATEQYSHWDTSYYSGTTMVIGEVKERTYESSAFSDWYMETFKYNELMKIKDKYQAKGMDVRIHYINLFSDNQVIIWDITNMSLNQVRRTLGATTLEDKGTRDKMMYQLWKAESAVWEPIKPESLPEEPYDEDYDDGLPF